MIFDILLNGPFRLGFKLPAKSVDAGDHPF
ncbi:hypothetical protein PSI9734_01531 [Pseudidiomarina piscicola]|uniref:Uncharacterized protein n=1 Tax=Pseudidiomarina piscicola TaxID=2614830 RepID=A0A6S6WQ75_9GAMM|nr:hypothetical protein PSI9734_01531 [Pseudidiomarina piscicola]VZT40624.1 hypothetical protein PSI9734_01531 [Pseudomonas aeruginosa]